MTHWTILFGMFGDYSGNSWQSFTLGMIAIYYDPENRRSYQHHVNPCISTLPMPHMIKQQVSYCLLCHSSHLTLKRVLGATVPVHTVAISLVAISLIYPKKYCMKESNVL